MTSNTFRVVTYPILLALVLLTFLGCAVLKPSRKSSDSSLKTDSLKERELPVDPWSLGPDVFAQGMGDSVVVIEETFHVDLSQPESLHTISGDKSQQTLTDTFTAAASHVALSPASEPLLPDTVFTVQLGTFLEKDRAQALYDRASESLGIAGRIEADWPFYRLQFGQYAERTSADSLHRIAMSRGFYDARVLKIPSR
ncbi:MAG: SPOR domain-containing protein [Calditrichaeota bacterium]|nr:SPOR domain-containing protein [Calditrichota bacterium]